jgi:DNA-binding transcriptional MerR regulator
MYCIGFVDFLLTFTYTTFNKKACIKVIKMMINKTPVFNLSAACKETGVKAELLRAWESRYDLPKPQRSTGGHRLYSQYDIETIKWLRARQDEGLSISRAVNLWNELVETDRDPLLEYPQIDNSLSSLSNTQDTRIDLIRNRWLDACIKFDDVRAEGVLNQAFALYPVETVCQEILQHGLKVLGDRWYSGEASVQQEHFTTSMAVRRLEALILAMPNPTRQQNILLACPAGERHIFPLLLLFLILRRKGFNVISLGANVPLEQMKDTIEAIHPNLVVLSAQQLVSAASVKSTFETLMVMKIPLAYGGLIFNRIPELCDRIPAWFLGETISEAVPMVENLATKSLAFPPQPIQLSSLGHIAKLFAENRPLIEMTVHNDLQNTSFDSKFFGVADTYFSTGLESALYLGDPTFLEADLAWLEQFLLIRQLTLDQLNQYLSTYSRAIKNILGVDGAEITTWLDSFLSKKYLKMG